MRLLIIRHAVAVPRGTPDMEDDARPLTPKGRKRFRDAARGLANDPFNQALAIATFILILNAVLTLAYVGVARRYEYEQ